ncbi:hypothetical protein CC78DRAFT_582908 [Lojkania enalia]|uniref:Uncharacterized protein n=1 Tax=Lojkania enalia TaxID=147567 RepID=A0A9P4K718_9PLEO|nr:hypothetical protein CC78DRAFT_582908 [Didymosphaeria enalia]
MSNPIQAPRDGSDFGSKAAVLYKKQNLEGGNLAQDYIDIGAIGCQNLDMLFGSWDKAVRSWKVEKGFKCRFHTESGCPEKGQKVEYGNMLGSVAVYRLTNAWDRKLRSINCWETARKDPGDVDTTS